MPALTRIIGTAVVVGGLLIGCGGDDGDDTATDDPAADLADGEVGNSDDADDGGGSDGDSDFCRSAEDLERRFSDINGADAPEPDMFNDVSAAFDDLAEEAPDEIAEDLDTVAEALRRAAELLEDVDPADPTTAEGVEEGLAAIEEDLGDVEATTARVATYLEEECGIDLDGTSGDGTGDDGTGDDGTSDDGTSDDGSGDDGSSDDGTDDGSGDDGLGDGGTDDDGGETGTQLDEELEGEG